MACSLIKTAFLFLAGRPVTQATDIRSLLGSTSDLLDAPMFAEVASNWHFVSFIDQALLLVDLGSSLGRNCWLKLNGKAKLIIDLMVLIIDWWLMLITILRGVLILKLRVVVVIVIRQFVLVSEHHLAIESVHAIHIVLLLHRLNRLDLRIHIILIDGSSPRNSRISVILEGCHCLLGLVNWVHHVFIDLPINEDMGSVVVTLLIDILHVILIVVMIVVHRWFVLIVGSYRAVWMMSIIRAGIIRVVWIVCSHGDSCEGYVCS